MLLVLSCLVFGTSDGLTLGGPRLARGDELVYHGEVVEAGERIDNRFRKKHELEVRVFVLETRDGFADCAVMTLVRPLADPQLSGTTLVTDARREPLPPAVRLDLVRVDPRGRVSLLAPPPGPPPIPLGRNTPATDAPALPVDTPPVVELGMFIPLPAKPATVGATWAAPGRPPVVWSAVREGVWNGGRCVEVTATQQTDGYDRPAAALTGWTRTDTLRATPADGFASTVSRKTERREGASKVGWVEVTYELRPPNRYVGGRYTDVRREAEAAYGYGSELAALVAKSGKADPSACRAVERKVEQFLSDQSATGFRPALEAVRRRCEAAIRGEALPTPVPPTAKAEPPRVGKPAPDFVAPLVHSSGQFRLSAARGGPAVVVFFKPGSRTSAGALSVAEALYRTYPARLAVVAVAVSAGAEDANRQRSAAKLTVPVADGAAVRSAYGVETYPKFFVVDRAGLLAWQFDGYGPEVGYLAKEEVERQLATPERR